LKPRLDLVGRQGIIGDGIDKTVDSLLDRGEVFFDDTAAIQE
jgi:hypothetical protein